MSDRHPVSPDQRRPPYLLAAGTIAAALRGRDPALAARASTLRDAILANTTYGPPPARRATEQLTRIERA